VETSENLILKLNELLERDRFYSKKLDSLLREFRELENPKIVLIDFEYFNEARLHLLEKKKINYIRKQNFVKAAEYRDFERECQNYIDIKEEYGISRSMFYFEKEYLFYFYFGTTKIDKKVREYLKILQISRYLDLNIN
jgi:hypothetical protein